MDEQPSRRACDRCHDLKLRCPRIHTEKCSRCLRAGASCVFSPSNRGRRPLQHRRQDSHLSKWSSDRLSTVKLAPRVINGYDINLDTVELQNQRYLENNRYLQSQAFTVGHTSATSPELPRSMLPGLHMSVDPDVTIPESFTPPLSLSGEALESGLFYQFSSQDTTPLDPAADPALVFLEPFPEFGVPKTNPRAPGDNGINHEIPQLPSQQSTPSSGSTSHSKYSAQNQFLQQFMRDLLELDVDLIQHTLQDDQPPIPHDTNDTTLAQSVSECAVDRTFLLTQRFIKLLRRGGPFSHEPVPAQRSWQPAALSASSPFSSRFQQLITSTTPQSPHRAVHTDPQDAELRLDEGSILHALSTYMRFLEAYHNKFSQTADRFGRALADGDPIPLPRLQIGEFSLDDSTSHIAVVIQSALRLLDRLGGLVNKLTIPHVSGERDHIENSVSSSPPSAYSALTAVMSVVRERESQVTQAAARLQSCCPEGRQS